MRALTRIVLALSTVSTIAPALSAQGPLASYRPVTEARLEDPEPGNWLFYAAHQRSVELATMFGGK